MRSDTNSDLTQTTPLSHTHPPPPPGGYPDSPALPPRARPSLPFRPQLILSLILPLLSTTYLVAQPPAQHGNPKPHTISALFLSDIHFDPFADPAKVAKLSAAPASDWPGLLAAPASSTQPADSTALQKACPVRGVDTPYALWQSSLSAIYSHAQAAEFVTISGDLLAHSFDCKYKTLLPNASHADYLAFVEKTIQYVLVTLRATVSSAVPIYAAMGNNDSGCTDYALDPTHDDFLAATAELVADALPRNLPAADAAGVVRDFSAGGYYSVPLAAVPHTRLIVLDDLFFSTKYVTCGGKPDPAPAAAQLAWLEAQLTSARQHNERVWVMGHIPPGVDPFSTIRNLPRVCFGAKPTMFLSSESLADLLARNRDIVRLAIFGHTHSDEMRLLTPQPTASTQRTTDNAGAPHLASEMWAKGVPVKIVSSITPVNGNRPTFTLAKIDPATASLADFTVIEASNLTGVDTTWAPEYTYSTAYRQPAFDSASLSSLIQSFSADPAAKSAASQAYLRNYFPGDVSALIQFAWPQYTCAMTGDPAAFAACACRAVTPGTPSAPGAP
jgi:sphingomyelin phosphodiesterase acid-like 3